MKGCQGPLNATTRARICVDRLRALHGYICRSATVICSVVGRVVGTGGGATRPPGTLVADLGVLVPSLV
ncbi:hypothetical protein ACOMHN_050986 [Nucella lapillus]